MEGPLDRRPVGPPDALQAADGPLGTHVEGRRVVVEPSRIAEHGLVEYHVTVDADTVRLFAMRTRPDKTTANGLHVVAATVRDVVEAITPDELAGA